MGEKKKRKKKGAGKNLQLGKNYIQWNEDCKLYTEISHNCRTISPYCTLKTGTHESSLGELGYPSGASIHVYSHLVGLLSSVKGGIEG